MDRFVAMIWNRADESRAWQVNAWSDALQRQSHRWTRVFDQPGARIYAYHHRGDAPVVAEWDDDQGIVIGVLFERGNEKSGRIRRLSRTETAHIAQTRGDHLICRYWGNYVAIWRDADKRQTTVLRDPCGAVPCFSTALQGVDLLFSHANDIADLPSLSFTINWPFLQAFVLSRHFVTKHTGLREVTELLSGERLEWRSPDQKHFSWAWNACQIAAQPVIRDFETAKGELRQTAEACFAGWGTEYGKILVSLSGGLDSSILVNLLRRVSDAAVTGQHYVGVGYEQHELALARLAASHADVSLVESELDADCEDMRHVLNASRCARPKVQSLGVLFDRLASELADKIGADAYMIGQGGDNLFITRAGAKHTLADYLRLRGLSGRVLNVAYDAAVLQRCSIWEAMLNARRETLSTQWKPFAFLDNAEWSKRRPFSFHARDISESYKMHPWFAEATPLPSGKRAHLMNVVALNNYYVDYSRGLERDVIYPLVSQPIVELALRTPTYVLCDGGFDRALERQAFADLIPEQIMRRTAKGGNDHYQMRVLQRNAGFYRELVLNGALIKQGWVQHEEVDRMLSADRLVHGGGARALLHLVTTEAWLTSWTSSAAREAA